MLKTNSSKTQVHRKKGSNILIVLLKGFFLGNAWWARVRMAFMLGAVFLIASISARFFEKPLPIRVWNDLAFPLLLIWISLIYYLLIIRDIFETEKSDSKIFAYSIIFFIVIGYLLWLEPKVNTAMKISGPSLERYLLMPLLGLVGAILAGAWYVQDIYNLESYSFALLYLLASFCGIAYPSLTISEGQKQISQHKDSRLVSIGGPGYISIKPGNVLLLEHLHSPADIHSAGTFFIPKFASIASIANLDDQLGAIDSIKATTKDGITVTVKDIQFRYRIWSDGKTSDTGKVRSIINPYPFTIQAVRNIAYNRNVGVGGLTTWFDSVKGAVTGTITSHISKSQLDQIIAPRYEEKDPRQQIGEQLFTPVAREKLKAVGARLLWCDIGHFEVEEYDVMAQRLETWRAEWVGSANVTRAYGEAQRIAFQELGRAEAQADMLKSIIHAFDDIDVSKDKSDQNIRSVILMRTAQVLEALTETNMSMPETKNQPPSKPDETKKQDK